MRTLEELGIGRPSTYASIIGTILDRGYVFKKGTALVPSFLAFSVVQLLEQHFGRLVDYGFTARMEDDLDRIAAGDQDRQRVAERLLLRRSTAHDGPAGARRPTSARSTRARSTRSSIGNGIVLRVGRYGPYLERDGQRANVPEDIVPDELTVEKAEELLAQPSGDRELGVDPGDRAARSSRAPAATARTSPRRSRRARRRSRAPRRSSSRWRSTRSRFEEALQLLSLPRVVGESERRGGDGAERPLRARTSSRGRSRARSRRRSSSSRSRSRTRSRCSRSRGSAGAARQAAAPLKEVGADPVSGKPIVVKSGRFGPYVTDGETNASLRSGDDPEEITLDRAIELLADRRARGPAKKPASRRREEATSRKRSVLRCQLSPAARAS